MADQRTIPEGKRNAFYRSPEIPEKEKNGNPRSTPKVTKNKSRSRINHARL